MSIIPTGDILKLIKHRAAPESRPDVEAFIEKRISPPEPRPEVEVLIKHREPIRETPIDTDVVIDPLLPLPPFEQFIPFNVEISVQEHVSIPIKSLLTNIIKDSFSSNFELYFDNLRNGKTLLNFGNDNQFSIINWKLNEDATVVLKLKDSLPTNFLINSKIFISRELENSVYDTIKFLPISQELIPQLRPNRSTKSNIAKSRKITATLNDLIPHIGGGTGSLSVSSSYKNFVTNQILENYYDRNHKSIDINVDYSNFRNFVTFGSAQKRLDVFKSKLEKIQELIVNAPIFIENLNISASSGNQGTYSTVFGTLHITSAGSASLLQSGSSSLYHLLSSGSVGVTSSIDYVNSSINTSIQIQELIRTFDDYERKLWFRSNLPYSSSDDLNHSLTNQFTKSDFTYPKILGIPLSTNVSSSTTWYSEMSEIASTYDENNVNKLRDNLPSFLLDDSNSVDFLTFVDLIGHHFDNIKSYISNIETLSSRYPKVDEEISGDMAKKVLESFGINAPSIASIENLIRYITGDNISSVSYKNIADEYYKRYIHALPFLLKTKGTKQSVNSLLNVFGINPDILTVKEALSNRYTTIEPTKFVTNEQNFSLTINSGSYITIPFSSSLRSPQTVQITFALLDDRTQTVLKFDNKYGLDAKFHPSGSINTYYSNIGRLELLSGSVVLVSSSYFDLFDENYVSVQLKNDSSGVIFDIRKIENGDLTFSQSLQEPLSMSNSWNTLSELYIGVPALSSSTGYTSASVDEFRVWGEKISEGKFIEYAENPGMYAGNSYTSSLEELFVRLSFNLPTNATNGFVVNTSPYISRSFSPNLTNLTASGFSSGTSPYYQTIRNIRTIIQSTYDISANKDITDMIRIAPDAPASMSLSSTNVTVPVDEKFNSSSVGSHELDISISPVDAIDREIVRSFGGVNLGDYIGRPIDRNADRYELLDEVEDVFIRELAPVIEYNNFIRFFDKFLHLFYESVDQYLPARSRVRKGIVIRSPVLNRTKVNTRTNIKFDGETSRRTRNSVSGSDTDVVRSGDVLLSLVPTTEQLSTQIYSIFGNQDRSYQLPNLGGRVNTLSDSPILSYYDTHTGSINVSDTVASIISELNHGYDIIGLDSLNATLTRPFKESDVISLNVFSGYGTSSISPISDMFSFTRYGNVQEAMTYFNSPYGLYYVDTIRYTPVTQSWMPSAPTVSTWLYGTTYRFGDVVLQPYGTTGSNGKELTGNGEHYVLKNQGSISNNTMVSYNPPQLDTSNWTKLGTIKEIYQSLVRVAYVAGNSSSLSILTSLTSSYDSIPIQYTRKHFRFYRENSVGARRRTYLGTLNTINTSFDRGYPFEVFDININELQVTSPQPCD